MAIELIKNGAVIASPFKTSPKQGETTENNIEISAPEAKITASSDSVVITNTVTQIKKSFESSTESSVDVERLARIKQAIENGTYEINPDRIAAKMLQFDFLGQGNST